MRARFGREYGECIDPARVRVEPDGFSIREDQILGERSERDDKLAVRLTEAGACLKFGDPIPKHCGKAAARKTLPPRKTASTQNGAGLTPARQNVLPEIGRCAHRTQNVDSRNGGRRRRARPRGGGSGGG